MPDLSDLTDEDIMLNLYLTVVMAIEITDADPATVSMSVNRMTDDEGTTDQSATLEDLMTEVERRLKIDTTEVIDA